MFRNWFLHCRCQKFVRILLITSYHRRYPFKDAKTQKSVNCWVMRLTHHGEILSAQMKLLPIRFGLGGARLMVGQNDHRGLNSSQPK